MLHTEMSTTHISHGETFEYSGKNIYTHLRRIGEAPHIRSIGLQNLITHNPTPILVQSSKFDCHYSILQAVDLHLYRSRNLDSCTLTLRATGSGSNLLSMSCPVPSNNPTLIFDLNSYHTEGNLESAGWEHHHPQCS